MSLIEVNYETILEIPFIVQIWVQGVFFTEKVNTLCVWNKAFAINEAAVQTLECQPRPFWAREVKHKCRQRVSQPNLLLEILLDLVHHHYSIDALRKAGESVKGFILPIHVLGQVKDCLHYPFEVGDRLCDS
jgi:hypothetical protein